MGCLRTRAGSLGCTLTPHHHRDGGAKVMNVKEKEAAAIVLPGRSGRHGACPNLAHQLRFIWQLVGVLATKAWYSATGTSVMPVFSGL